MKDEHGTGRDTVQDKSVGAEARNHRVEQNLPEQVSSRPWRLDPALANRFHPSFPDDLQIVVHDGSPRRTGRQPELCWVRIMAAENGPPRPNLDSDEINPESQTVYVAELLNRPHQLHTVQQGQSVRLYAHAGSKHPLMVTADYLAERADWQISPCDSCGLNERLDPPSMLARAIFPDSPTVPLMFTAACPLCGARRLLRRVGQD